MVTETGNRACKASRMHEQERCGGGGGGATSMFGASESRPKTPEEREISKHSIASSHVRAVPCSRKLEKSLMYQRTMNTSIESNVDTVLKGHAKLVVA